MGHCSSIWSTYGHIDVHYDVISEGKPHKYCRWCKFIYQKHHTIWNFGLPHILNVIPEPDQIITQPWLLLALLFAFISPELIKNYKSHMFGTEIFFVFFFTLNMHSSPGWGMSLESQVKIFSLRCYRNWKIHWILVFTFWIKLYRLAIHVPGVSRCQSPFLCMALIWNPPLPKNNSNMVLIGHIINDINTAVSLELDLIRIFIFIYPPPLLISTSMLFNPQSFLVGVNCVQCLYVAGRGAIKGYPHTWVGLLTILFGIKLIDG